MVKRGKSRKIIGLRRKISMLERKLKIFEPPLSIKIVSIFFYVTGILTLLFGLITIIAAIIGVSFISSVDKQKLMEIVPGLSMWDVLLSGGFYMALIAIGLFIVIWGIINFYIGKGLWKGRKLAFVGASIIILLGFLSSLITIIKFSYSGLVSLIIYGVLGYLLFFEKKSRSFFDLGSFKKISSFKKLKKRR